MMNFQKREIQKNKLALAALLLGAFTLNPMASALDPAPETFQANPVLDPELEEEQLLAAERDGMKWGELKRVAPDFTVKIEGDMIVFSGSMPKECAKGRSMSEVESSKGQHALKINLPNCANGLGSLTTLQQKERVQIKGAFPAKSFDSNQDGVFCLLYSATGDDEMKCDTIMIGKEQLAHISVDSQDQSIRKTELSKKEKDLKSKVGLLCKQGDFQTLGLELEAAAEWLGDLTTILDQIGKAKVQSLTKSLKKAKDPEELKLAYEALLAEDIDPEVALNSYVSRRLEMSKAQIANRSLSIAALEDEIGNVESDLEEVDAFDDNKAAIAWFHVELGNRLAEDKDYDGAEKQYTSALRTSDQAGKVKIEKEMAKMFLAAAEACQEENKLKPGKCDALAKKAQKHMDKAIAQQSRVRGEEALEELNGMKLEKIQQFGMPGVQIKVSGFGIYNPYGGAYDQRKVQMYQTGQQELYMQMMMQRQMQQQGMGNGMQQQGMGGASGGSHFR